MLVIFAGERPFGAALLGHSELLGGQLGDGFFGFTVGHPISQFSFAEWKMGDDTKNAILGYSCDSLRAGGVSE